MIYRYTYGCNRRAIIAFIIGVAPSLPGFINSINTHIGNAPHTFAWIQRFVITSLAYVLTSRTFPPVETIISQVILPDKADDGDEFSAVETEGEIIRDDVQEGMISKRFCKTKDHDGSSQ